MIAFVVFSAGIVYVSRASLRAPGRIGIYRFFPGKSSWRRRS
jgi:hypothetical protein